MLFTYNNIQIAGDCPRTRKYVEADNFTGEITGEKFVIGESVHDVRNFSGYCLRDM
jgi:hypothetical protein